MTRFTGPPVRLPQPVFLHLAHPGFLHLARRPVSTGHWGKTDQMSEFTFTPLTPASFLDRAAAVFADRTAIVDGERRLTYRDMSDRCHRLAGALAAQGVGREDRIAALCANTHV